MPPFCRYCHSDSDALLYCPLRKKATICHLCNVPGHIAKFCPRKNIASESTGKRRKLPNADNIASPSFPSDQTAPITATDPSDHTLTTLPSSPSPPMAPSHIVQVDVRPSASVIKPVEEPRRRLDSPTRSTRTTTGIDTVSPKKQTNAAVCKHCGLLGHKRTMHKECLKNPLKLA